MGLWQVPDGFREHEMGKGKNKLERRKKGYDMVHEEWIECQVPKWNQSSQYIQDNSAILLAFDLSRIP